MVQGQGQDRLRIGAVARRAGVSVDTVRYYERRGVLDPPDRLPSGYRVYPGSVVARIGLARRLQGLGMSLDEVVDALRSHGSGTATCRSERWRLEAVLERTRERLAALAAVQEDLEAVLRRCEAGRCELAP